MSKKMMCWVLGSGVLMVLAVFQPWERALSGEGFFTFYEGSISGTDGSNGGWLLVVTAAIAGGLFCFRRTSRDAGVWALLGGVAGLAVTVHALANMQSAIEKGGYPAWEHAGVDFGLVLALLASISMAIAGIVALVQARSAPAALGASSAPPVVPDSTPSATAQLPRTHTKSDFRSSRRRHRRPRLS